MKKVLSLLLSLSLVLLTTECKVSNMEPIPPNSAQLVYHEITKPFVFKSNVFILNVEKNGKLTFLNDKELIIEGDFKFSKPNSKFLGNVVPDGSVVYGVIKTESFLAADEISLKLFEGFEISGGVKYVYEIVPWEEGFKQGALIYKTTVQATLEVNIEKTFIQNENRNAKIKGAVKATFNPVLNVTTTTLTSEEIVDGKIVSGTKKIKTTVKGALWLGHQGELTGEVLSDPLNLEFGTVYVPIPPLPVPLAITIAAKIRFFINGSLKADYAWKPFEGTCELESLIEFKNGEWKEKESKPPMKKIDFGSLRGYVSGEVKTGVEVEIDLYVMKFKAISFDVSAGQFAVILKVYGGANVKCASKNANEAPELLAGVSIPEVRLGAACSSKSDGTITCIYEKRIQLENLIGEVKYNHGINLDALCPGSAIDNVNLSFITLLKTKSFPIYEGNSPPNLTTPWSIFTGGPTILVGYTNSSDEFNKFKEHGYVKFRFSNQENSTIKVETKRNTDKLGEVTFVNLVSDVSRKSFITGANGKFTIIGECVGYSYDKDGNKRAGYTMEYAISGEKVGNEVIQNAHYAFRINSTIDDPYNQLLREGDFRYFKVNPLGAISVF